MGSDPVRSDPMRGDPVTSDVGEVSVISCDDCVMQHTDACDDCVVTFICGREPDAAAVVVDVAEARAMRLLGDAGLVPPLRRVRKSHVEGPQSARERVVPSTVTTARMHGPRPMTEPACESSTSSGSRPIVKG